jgi:hypothetical protein
VTITNSGDLPGTATAVLKIDNNVQDTKVLTLNAGESQKAVFTISGKSAGNYAVDVNGQSGTLTVKTAPSTKPFILRNWWILVVLVIVVVAITVIVGLTIKNRGTSNSK